MGFLEPIPAAELGALYDTAKHVLILSASGRKRNFTSGISFKPVPTLGGLKFELEGWVGPLTGGTSPYSYQQSFPMQLPNLVLSPSVYVIIIDANHPEGIQIPIRYTGLLPPQDKETAAQSQEPTPTPASADDSDKIQRSIVPGEVKVNVLYKESFEIKEAAVVPSHGRVNIKFDPKFLELQNASIQDKDIVWKFDSLQTGHTQVVVSIEGGIAQFHITKVYDVFVFLPLLRPPPANMILTFTGRVNVAINIIKEKYPEASFFSVEGTPSNGKPVDNSNEITHLKVACKVNKGAAIIESTGWNQWGDVKFMEIMVTENLVPWPVKIDAVEADDLMRKAGVKGRFTAMNLDWPIYPGDAEPYYFFFMVDGETVRVGVNTKKVYINRVGEAILPAGGK
ncbi:hypothetical protein GP486_001159 [Trichoglossum hirsutum]|uniref:Uncharacterized protein n=1 Tax=Trichoglossum hirsutum TaxID=265104 RepID=A0A9P8RTA5_9PEZI|nr:hypothetical protein GP486_001159 [Trichoglossum hirsutum]